MHFEPKIMATSSTIVSSSFIPPRFLIENHQNLQPLFSNGTLPRKASKVRLSFKVQAAKLPSGVEVPKVVPKFNAPFLGFTRTAEIWNSRACMIGLIGVFVVELILNKGILQVIGVDVGKGLDLPL